MEHINWKSPWVIGGIGVVLALLLLSRGSSSSSDASLGVASQSVATSANVQLAGLSTQLQTEQDQTGAAIDIAGLQSQSTNLGLALGYLDNIDNNNVARDQIAAGVNVNANNNTTLLKLTSADNSTFAQVAPELATISANNAQALASINANESTQLAEINQAGLLNRLNSSNNNQLLNTGLGAAPGILSGIAGIIGSL